MKNIITFFLILFTSISISAQTQFTFEDEVPSNWTVANGEIAISGNTYKEGTHSLEWKASGDSKITIPVSFKILSQNGAFFYIYSPKVTNDVIEVSFINDGTVVRKANILCNFQGWREFNRTYKEYETTSLSYVTEVEIALNPNKNIEGERKIFFDDVEFNNTANLDSKIHGTHMVLDLQYLKGNTGYLELYALERDIPVAAPTQKEIIGLNIIRERQARQSATPSKMEINRAATFINSFNIEENPDGTMSGKIINTSYQALTDAYISSVFTHLVNLAASETHKELFKKGVRYILDQGIGAGCNYEMGTSIDFYNAGKQMPALILNVAYACEGELRQRLLDFAQWFSYYNEAYRPEETYKAYLIADYMYLYLQHFTAIAAFQADDAKAVAELKALKRYVERATEYSPGSNGILKPDGTGFHHNTHYNNYMYAYMPWTSCMWGLRGTVFRINEAAYERFKKAVLSLYIMATKNTVDRAHYFSNAFSGRNCFGEGIIIQFGKTSLAQLIEVGEDIKGNEDELKAAYNYFNDCNDYDVSKADYSGFYAFNYSPAAIYRKDNWVVSMRSNTTKFWGAEIYSGQNRFGRYQSHGSLDILYDGSLERNGYHFKGANGGWDWNMVPGTTTVHYTSWDEMMPGKSTVQRFDQFGKDKNFSGALSMGSSGIFATDFTQKDSWGATQCYTPTNLEFKKSMFAFGGMIVCMGSDISSSGTYSDDMHTATNLFQNTISSYVGDLIVNGEIFGEGRAQLSSDKDNWIITPAGTGYYLPKGNDPIVVSYGEQTSPRHSGEDYKNPTDSYLAAKAYIDHGVKPDGANDIFIAVPAATEDRMESISGQLQNNVNDLFRFEEQSSTLHALTYIPDNITAYAFYDAVDNLDFGIVKATTFRHLLMVKPDSDDKTYHLAICNPDLCPETDDVYGWHSTSSSTDITLRGKWELVTSVENVSVSESNDDETVLHVIMTDGQPSEFELLSVNDSGIKGIDSHGENIRIRKEPGGIRILFNEPASAPFIVKIFTPDGRIYYNSQLSGGNSEYHISDYVLQKGVNIIQVIYKGMIKNHKIIL